jgi:hypothetical protein
MPQRRVYPRMSAHRLFVGALCLSLYSAAAFSQTDDESAARLAERFSLRVTPEITAKSEKLLEDWKARFDEEKFNYLVAAPFVIAGNGRPDNIRRYRDGTIIAAARSLQKQFFKKQPNEPVLILLIESEGPYKRLAKKWFGDNDVPYYGYFRHDNVMVMNVGTGTGTLVHELTHALIKPDFPSVPGWFNEGLASLYEQCSLGFDDSIKGHENWRLPGLQKAINAEKLRPLGELIAERNFYRSDLVGVNYAQARYLMFYLQEKKLLQKYYQQFRDSAKDDPTGLESLKNVIAPQSLEEFEKQWRKWVMGLEFRSGR